MELHVWMWVVPAVLAFNFYWWKTRGGRAHRDAMVEFEAFVRRQVVEPVDAVAVAQPAGVVGRQARAEWLGAPRTIAARLLTGSAATVQGPEVATPPSAALALTRSRLVLIPWRFGADKVSYEVDGAPIWLGREGMTTTSRSGALTIQLSVESAGKRLDVELVRDPNGMSSDFVHRLCG